MNHHDGLTHVDLYFSRLNYTKSLHFRTIYKQKRDSASNSRIFCCQQTPMAKLARNDLRKTKQLPAGRANNAILYTCLYAYFSVFSVQSSSISVLNLQPRPSQPCTILNYHQSQNNLANQEDHWKNLRRRFALNTISDLTQKYIIWSKQK
jgi:hypothetical protein